MSSTPELNRAVASVGADVDSRVQVPGEDVALPNWLIGSSAFCVVVADAAATIMFVNEAFAKSLGFESAAALVGRNLRESFLLEEADWEAWQSDGDHMFRLRDVSGAPVTFRGESGKSFDREQNPLYRCVLSREGDSYATGQLLEHAARMEAVAGLSSGIAHDFNNLLTVLVGNLYLLGEELRGNESAFARIKAARDTALRGSELTRHLLNYARGDETNESEVRPGSVVHKLEPLLEKLVGSRIELGVDVTAEGYTVAASPAQLESAIVNLVINARDAIDGAGTIRVAVHEAERAKTGESRLVISVSDDGPGIPADVKERIFEPFFTTKAEGRGTGLGLSMVRWFAESASGVVEIDSAPGSGTTISILLPLAASEHGDTTCSKTIPLSVLPSGDERIALMIDDAEMRAMTQQTLSVLGYDVQRVSAGDMAQDDGTAVDFDLAVVDADDSQDLIALVEELRRNSCVRVLALTARNIAELDRRNQLHKPFSLIELANGVRDVLDGESGSD
jgi:signal transduction histidine kinase/CheY-like chemotaxis protein